MNGPSGRDLGDKRGYAPIVSASDFRVYCPGAFFGLFQPIIQIISYKINDVCGLSFSDQP